MTNQTEQDKKTIQFITLDENALEKAVTAIKLAVSLTSSDDNDKRINANKFKYLGYHQQVIDELASFTVKVVPNLFGTLPDPSFDIDGTSEFNISEVEWNTYIEGNNIIRKSYGIPAYSDEEAAEMKANGNFPLAVLIECEFNGKRVQVGDESILNTIQVENMFVEDIMDAIKESFTNFVLYLDKTLSAHGEYDLTRDSVLYGCPATFIALKNELEAEKSYESFKSPDVAGAFTINVKDEEVLAHLKERLLKANNNGQKLYAQQLIDIIWDRAF